MTASLHGYELSYDDYPTLYRIGGKYMVGLAELMGAFSCYHGDPVEESEHEFADDKCVHCGIRRSKPD